MKQVNSPIEFYGDDFGADARLCHPSKEGILLWCPPAAAAFDHGRAISPFRLQPVMSTFRPRNLRPDSFVISRISNVLSRLPSSAMT